MSRHDLMRWPIAEFYHELECQIDEGTVSRRYQEITNRKR